MRSSSTSGESFTGIYKVLQVFTMEKGDGKNGEKLKKRNFRGSVPNLSGDIPATIDDMDRILDELQRMPENGKVILFALFQLALVSVRSQEAFCVFCDECSGLNAADLSSLLIS